MTSPNAIKSEEFKKQVMLLEDMVIDENEENSHDESKINRISNESLIKL